MESLDSKIAALLNGCVEDDEDKEFLNVDYTIQQQNYELCIRGIEHKATPDFKPKLGISVTYVVAAVVFNDKHEVLMMQEAKSSCAGTWYLPAGRVEPAETFEVAVKREVKEETGLDFEPTTLLKVESSHGTWFRFTYTGNIVGGSLKTVANADQESLQASYFADISALNLRSQDCVKLISLGREYLEHGDSWHSPRLTLHRSVPNIYLRTLITVCQKKTNLYHILVAESLIPHIPLCEVNSMRSVHATLKRFMQYIFGPEQLPHHKPVGLLTVEHNFATQPDHCDGLCLTLLVVCKDPLESITATPPGFSWKQLDSNVQSLLISKLKSKYQSIVYTVL